MIAKNAATIMLGAMASAIALPFSAMAFAEPSETEDARKAKINELGDAFGAKYLKWIEEDDSKAKRTIKTQMDGLVLQLEKYGVTYTEKYEKNPRYWDEISSRHIGESPDSRNDLLPLATAAANPFFYAGYAYDCWWLLTCSEWNGNGVQIGEDQTKDIKIHLIDDHAWSVGKYKVTGSGLAVEFDYVAKLKDGSATIQDATDDDSYAFYYSTVHIDQPLPKYENPEDSWNYYM